MTDLNAPVDTQGILPSRPPTNLDEQQEQDDFDVSTSVGASINESMMMPPETLATGLADFRQPSSLGTYGEEDIDAGVSMWQKQMKVVDQSIRQNPYPYVAGALGLGLVIGRSLFSSRSHSV